MQAEDLVLSGLPAGERSRAAVEQLLEGSGWEVDVAVSTFGGMEIKPLDPLDSCATVALDPWPEVTVTALRQQLIQVLEDLQASLDEYFPCTYDYLVACEARGRLLQHLKQRQASVPSP